MCNNDGFYFKSRRRSTFQEIVFKSQLCNPKTWFDIDFYVVHNIPQRSNNTGILNLNFADLSVSNSFFFVSRWQYRYWLPYQITAYQLLTCLWNSFTYFCVAVILTILQLIVPSLAFFFKNKYQLNYSQFTNWLLPIEKLTQEVMVMAMVILRSDFQKSQPTETMLENVTLAGHKLML